MAQRSGRGYRAAPPSDAMTSIWRAVAAFRVASLLVCLYLIARWYRLYEAPAVALLVGAGMIVVTAVVVVCAVRVRRPGWILVGLDLAVTAALTVASIGAQTVAQRHGEMPTLTTIWAAGPLLEAALLAGPVGGVIAALVQLGASMVVRDGYDGRTINAGVLLILAGLIVGYTVTLLRRAEARLAASTAARAALEERERLAREIHDDVLQVLALVHRTGAADGGEWARLAELAADAEVSLRRLAVARSTATDTPIEKLAQPAGAVRTTAFADRLRALGDARVTVSVPAEPVGLAADVQDELVAVVRAALDNVSRHAGPDARAWVFVEPTDDDIRVSVRDDGVGFGSDRLARARADGRLGVAASIHGRVIGLGGTCSIVSAPGEGTEIEIAVPLS